MAECPTADTKGKPSFWMCSTPQQLGPRATCVPQIQLQLPALTLPEEHQEQDLQLPGLPFNCLAGEHARCEYGTVKSSGLKESPQRCDKENVGTPGVPLGSRLPALLLSEQWENPRSRMLREALLEIPGSFAQTNLFRIWKTRRS